MTQHDPAQAVVAACKTLLDLREAEEAAVAARDHALAGWWPTSGASKVHAGAAVQQLLRAQGWTAKQIQRVGVSDGRVRVVLDHAR